MQLNFSSFSTDDDDYMGYDYSLTGQFSEVRIVYLNRFVQEVSCWWIHIIVVVQSMKLETNLCRLLVTLWGYYLAMQRVLLSWKIK